MLGSRWRQRKLSINILPNYSMKGVAFAVWAPNAYRVSVVGPFNNWDGRRHAMRYHYDCGIRELFVPGISPGELFLISSKQSTIAVTAKASIRSIGGLSKHRIYIEDVYPVVDGGRFPIKRIVGEEIDVWADIFHDGHVVLAAELLWRREGADKWLRVPMVLHDHDRWTASFTPPKPGRYVYAIEAWTDVFASWRRDFLTKRGAGMDVSLEIEEGRNLLADLKVRNSDQARLIRDVCQKPDIVEDPAPLLSEDLAAAASKGQQSDLTRSATYPLVVDRPIARASAWYEMMPRSQSAVFGKHGTFDDCIN